ncbi:MAG TPA: hypothetical protein PLI51_06500 [bacterium]|nr:hypothetical protein [bacterium]HPQ66359.1 hypothetical protein [bacterium]
MVGIRILAFALALLFLATAAAAFFYQEPTVGKMTSWLWQKQELKDFINSRSPRDAILKDYLHYLGNMAAVVLVGCAVLFAISGFSPMKMRPFLVTMIVVLAGGVAMDIYCGITIKSLSPYWWAIDAGAGFVVLVLLIVLFPRRRYGAEPAPLVYPEDEEGYLEE